MGLPPEPSNKTMGTKLMTIGLYFLGGLAAAAVARLVEGSEKHSEELEYTEYIEEVYQ
jgi:hypothetical protein